MTNKRENSLKLWPKELLAPELHTDARIFAIQFDARYLHRNSFVNNVPDRSLKEFAKSIAEDLREA